MKVRKLNWASLAGVGIIALGLYIGSCNNSDKSEKTSTETDTSNRIDNTRVTPSIDSMPVMDSTGNITNRTVSNSKKRGKVNVASVVENRNDKMTADASGYYNYAEVSPVYSGGNTAISDYISNNIEYPQDAIDNNVGGTVNVQFGIDENGKITNAKAIGTKLGYGLDEEAVRVVSKMPKWNPGTVKGKNVKTWMIIPITYRIEE